MPTTAIVKFEDNTLISLPTNYQGFNFDLKKNVCTPTNNRAKLKWKTLERYFPAIVKGQTFVDLGANFGFFLWKALEYGAEKVIGIEANRAYHGVIEEELKYLDLPVTWLRLCFPLETVEIHGDVVMFLSLIQHTFPKLSIPATLGFLKGMADKFIIFEWVGRRDRAVIRKGWADAHPEYSKSEFLKACDAADLLHVQLGLGHHPTRTIYLLKAKEI